MPLPKGAIVTTSGKVVRDDDLAQFWGNGHKGRTDVYKPTDLAWSRLEKFLNGNDDALVEWQNNRYVPGAMDQEMCPTDERAVCVAKELCRIQQRIIGLFNTAVASETQTLPRSAKIIKGLLDLTPSTSNRAVEAATDAPIKSSNANAKATAVLADTWSIAAARSDLGEFSQNFAALTFCFQLLATKGLDGL